MIKKWWVVLASTGVLSGCIITPLNTGEPHFLKGSQRYEANGRQGWMPGKNIRFGSYASEINKGKTTSDSHYNSTERYEEEDYNREVVISQAGPDGSHISLKYKQHCAIKRYHSSYENELHRKRVKMTQAPNLGGFELNGKQWYLEQWVLDDRAGNQFRIDPQTIFLNDRVVAEFSPAPWKIHDHVWLKAEASEETKLISAVLLSYVMTEEPLPCKSRLIMLNLINATSPMLSNEDL